MSEPANQSSGQSSSSLQFSNRADDEPSQTPWSRLAEDIAVVLWTSFLVACVATMLFFGFVDPTELNAILGNPWWLPDHMATYALSFFGFWVLTASSAALTAYMLDTSHAHGVDASTQQRRA